MCKLCLNQKKVSYSGNTTNLCQHLQSHHPVEFAAVVGKGSGSASTSSASTAKQSMLKGVLFQSSDFLLAVSKLAR